MAFKIKYEIKEGAVEELKRLELIKAMEEATNSSKWTWGYVSSQSTYVANPNTGYGTYMAGVDPYYKTSTAVNPLHSFSMMKIDLSTNTILS